MSPRRQGSRSSFLDVAKVCHSGKRVLPDRLLVVDTTGGEAEWRMDDDVRMKQVIETVQIARITGS